MPTFSRNMMQNKIEKFAPGKYEVEIANVSYKESGPTDPRPWKKIVFISEVVDPREHAGKKFIFSLFDNQFALILDMMHSIGKKDSEIFDEKENVSDEKIKAILEGQFVCLRVGVKGEYNTIVEVIEDEGTRKDNLEV